MAPPRRVRKESLWHTVHPEQTRRETSVLGIHSTTIYICPHQILQKRFIYFQCQKINKPPSSTKNEKPSLQNYFPSIECAVLIDSGRAVSSAVEHRLHTAGVASSSLALPTNCGTVVKSVYNAGLSRRRPWVRAPSVPPLMPTPGCLRTSLPARIPPVRAPIG